MILIWGQRWHTGMAILVAVVVIVGVAGVKGLPPNFWSRTVSMLYLWLRGFVEMYLLLWQSQSQEVTALAQHRIRLQGWTKEG